MTIFEWPPLQDEAVRHLQNLVRINTTNPPGNETQAAHYLDHVLRAEGFEPVILEFAPGRGNLVARFKGDGTLPPFYSLAIPTWCLWRRNIGRTLPSVATWPTAACGAGARWI